MPFFFCLEIWLRRFIRTNLLGLLLSMSQNWFVNRTSHYMALNDLLNVALDDSMWSYENLECYEVKKITLSLIMYLPCGLYGWYCHDKKWLYWDLSCKRASILSLQNKRLKSSKILSLDWSCIVEVWKSYLQRNDALDILGETRMLNCKPIDSLISWIQMLNFFHMKNFLLDPIDFKD